MNTVLGHFELAVTIGRGDLLAQTLVPHAPSANPNFLHAIRDSSSLDRIEDDVKYGTFYNAALGKLGFDKQQKQTWLNIYVAYWKCICALLEAEESAGTSSDIQATRWQGVYNAWSEVARNVTTGYQQQTLQVWTLPCFYLAGKYLRAFAIRADDAAAAARRTTGAGSTAGDNALSDDPTDADAQENECLEDAARRINGMFGLCISDRQVPPELLEVYGLTSNSAPIQESRKWAIYNIANLLFKTYFRLNSLSLPKNVLASISSASDVPPLSAFPKSHQVTFHYYRGLVAFLSEDYQTAQDALQTALSLMPSIANADAIVRKNHGLILTYLIPCRMRSYTKLPSRALLASNPYLERLFAPLCTAVKKGDLAGFDAAMAAGEAEFARRRIYLTLERGRDLCLRNALRKVAMSAGWETGQEGVLRRSRIPIQEFIAGLRVAMGGQITAGGMEMEDNDEERDEVECMLANAIYKGLMKGYIARGPGIVVLSKTGAFPGTDM